jgi:hypothetical protein
MEVIAVLLLGLAVIVAIWFDGRERRREEIEKERREQMTQAERDAAEEKRAEQIVAYTENVDALEAAGFKSYMCRKGGMHFARHTNYPLFLWQWGTDLPTLRWKEGMKPVPLEEMTIVTALDQEDFDLRRLWLSNLPLGDADVRVIIRPSCRPPSRPILAFAGSRRRGHVILYMNKDCQITDIAQATTMDEGYEW